MSDAVWAVLIVLFSARIMFRKRLNVWAERTGLRLEAWVRRHFRFETKP